MVAVSEAVSLMVKVTVLEVLHAMAAAQMPLGTGREQSARWGTVELRGRRI